MIVEAGRDADVLEWMSAKGFSFHPPFVTLALVDRGAIVAAAIFNGYQQSNIDLSIVSDRPLPITRAHLRALFSYPFAQLRVNRVTVRTSATQTGVRKLIRRLGFKPEGKHPEFYGKDSAMTYGLLRRNCKWIR